MTHTRTGRASLGGDVSEAKARLQQAAATCVERHGVEKTRMDDIARVAGVSRPVIYRYFRDREHLLLTVLAERSRALGERARSFMSQQPTFGDALVEGLLFLADHGRRDPFMRHLIEPEGAVYAQHMLRRTGYGWRAASEFWAPVLDRAELNGELARDLDREEAYQWLADMGLLTMAQLRADDGVTDRLRSRLQTFLVPAFVDQAARAPRNRVGSATA